MKNYLFKSFDKATEYLEIPSKRKVVFLEKKKAVGWFMEIEGKISALFAKDKILFYQYGDFICHVTNDCKGKNTLIQDGQKKFQLLIGDCLRHEFTYNTNTTLIDIEPFEYIDEEDFDWGLFLSNIINSVERKNRIITTLSPDVESL